MENPQIGDIVTVASKSALRMYVIIEAVTTAWPPNTRWKVRHDDRKIDFVAGQGDLTLVLRPEIEVGDTLWHDGHEVTVANITLPHVTVTMSGAQRTEDLAEVSTHARPWVGAPGIQVLTPSVGRVNFGTGDAVMLYGQLVLENAAHLLATA